MSQKSAIGWTDATWNPITGCSHVSPGCVNCYAEALSLRFGRSTKPWTAQNAAENVKLHPERLRAPLRWREPKMIFVNSMSDLFHELVPDDFIDGVLNVVALAPRHTFQVLTKRPERMALFMENRLQGHAPLPNLWLGTSIEDQRRAVERIGALKDTPAIVRFVSCEPLLGDIRVPWGGVDWGIIGGETGSGFRAMDPAWAESLVAQWDAAGVAPFVKQDSGPRPGKQGRLSDALWSRKEYPVRSAPSPHTPTPEPPQ